jgi:hypothetical protein
LRSETSVKTETIPIDLSSKEELYQGIKNAIQRAKKQIIHQRIALRERTFHSIWFFSCGLFVISRIVIAYNPRSARKANIHK